MSIVFSMTAVGVAMGITAVSGAVSVINAFAEHRCGEREIAPIETRFSDPVLLEKTLNEHGFSVVKQENGSMHVVTPVGSVEFFYSKDSGSYWARAYDLVDEEQLAVQMGEVNDEYMLNVQKNNYLMLKDQIEESSNMSLEDEEILEDDTILLTINLN